MREGGREGEELGGAGRYLSFRLLKTGVVTGLDTGSWCLVFDLGIAIAGAFASGGAPGDGLLVWGVVGFVKAELLVWLFGCLAVGGWVCGR